MRGTLRVSLALSGASTGAIVAYFFMDLKQDTAALSNAGLAVMMGLAVLAFNYAQVFDGDAQSRSRVVRAGETCLVGAVMFLCASVLKYTRLNTKWETGADELMKTY